MRSFGGEGGRSSKDHIGSQGGGQDGPKKDHLIFERSLASFQCTIIFWVATFQLNAIARIFSYGREKLL